MNSDPIKFLIVDDIPDNLVVLEALLRRDGLEVLSAGSGAEALELLLVHEVALAFLDVQMPEMNGFELAELMRGTERTKHIPIIFVTAGTRDPQRLFQGYETGAVDFLYKPIEPLVLKGKADVFFELYRQRRELAHALHLNEMFVGILGHDLRNPLGSILMGTQLLARELQDDNHQRTLRRMLSAGKRMTDMIEQLLDLTRARLADGMGLVRSRTPLDVGGLLQRASDELRAIHPEREVVLEVQGVCVTAGDSGRLLQLFSNLIANALQHGAPGGPIKVQVHATEASIVVRVSNAGVIPQERLSTMFEPFSGKQNPDSRSRGLGLGLYISQQIALAHAGSILVESDEQIGTAFTVRLPRSEQALLAAPALH